MRYTKLDINAYRLAQEKFDKTDPAERRTFQRYLEDAYQHLQAQANPGEGPFDPWAE